MTKNSSAYRISILALFCAIIIIQNFVPLFGYIPVGPLDLTTIHITVIVAALVLGPRDGTIVGTVWGLITFVRAFVAPTSPLAPLVFTNPVISILPRALIGLFAGLIFNWLRTGRLPKPVSMLIASLVGALTNTLLVLGLIYLFYRTPQVAAAYQTNISGLMKVLLVVVATNGIPEAILAGIVGPLISLPLQRFRR